MNLSTNPTSKEAAQASVLLADASWKSFPYQSVQVQLHEGSVFSVPVAVLAGFAARRVAVLGVAPVTHLAKQVLPAVFEAPELLLEFARQMPWAELKQAAVNSFWRTPSIFVTEAYRSKALMTLQASGAVH